MKQRDQEIVIQDAFDMSEVATLFREYEIELDEDICFQGFEEEIAHLPGKYASPNGAILTATDSSTSIVAGVIALRPYEEGVCEMKRLYVRPQFRGKSLGRRLCEDLILRANSIGYESMVLDTLTKLEPAIALYKCLGFEEVEPYYDNPLSGVVYFRKQLAGGQ